MKTLLGFVIVVLALSGCAAAESVPEPMATKSQESSAAPSDEETTEPSAGETRDPTPSPTRTTTAVSPSPSAPDGSTATTTTPVAPTQAATPTQTATPAPVTPPPAPGFTMAEVSVNNTSASCWVVINSRVYNLTEWISNHPGGRNAITGLCGTDGTASFTSRHGGQSAPASALTNYDIGPLR